jgi:hypothetical protein
MTSANRVKLTFCEELVLGQTPVSPRMREVRLTEESLRMEPEFVQSAERRADRMNGDPIMIGQANDGSLGIEWSYPQWQTSLDRFLAGVMFDDWLNTPFRDNDGIADSVITGVTGATKTLAIAAGDAFVAGQLVRLTGFGQSANNGLRPVITGSATAPILGGGVMADEAAPPGTARIKAVGFAGAVGDIQATATGLSSTALDFTTFGLRPYTYIKIGGAALTNRYATGANNAFARVVSISAHAIELDDLPSGWLPDSGATKQIYIWTADLLRNGVTLRSFTKERSFLGQVVPTYTPQSGMVVGQFNLDIASKQPIKGSFQFVGMKGTANTIGPLDPTPDPPSIGRIMSSNVHVGQITLDGVGVGKPNWIKDLKILINNNVRARDASGNFGAVDIVEGDGLFTFELNTYFGSGEQLALMNAGTPGALFVPTIIDNQAVTFHAPRVTRTGGNAASGAKGTDVMLPLKAQSSYHWESNSQGQFERFEYIETTP